jgi:SET domain
MLLVLVTGMYASRIAFTFCIFAGQRRAEVIAYIPALCNFREIASRVTAASSSSSSSSSSSLGLQRSVPEQGALIDGVNKMNTVMNVDFFMTSPVLKQFYSKLLTMVDVRESSIPGAGKGLFAKKPIKANTIVSFYPVHALGTDNDQPFTTSNMDDELYFQTTPTSQSVYLQCTDQPIFRRTSLISDAVKTSTDENEYLAAAMATPAIHVPPLFLDVNPNRKIIDGWVSHIINDGAAMRAPSSQNNDNVEQCMLEYYQSSKVKKNCIHIPFGPSPIIATVTTKKIMKDEELFTTYGGVRSTLHSGKIVFR